jgi:hypothetical protein
MPERGWRGMWSPHDLGMMGGEDESADVAGRWGKVWRGGKVQVDCGGRPFGEKGAPLWGKGSSCCLLGRRFGDFLLFFHVAKS